MGYRIGFQCFDTKEAATDYQMSLVVPQIVQDGSLYYPIKQGNKWVYQGQEIDLSFGECDKKAEFKAGQELAFAFVGIFAAAFVFKFIVKFIYSAFWLETDVHSEQD